MNGILIDFLNVDYMVFVEGKKDNWGSKGVIGGIHGFTGVKRGYRVSAKQIEFIEKIKSRLYYA